MNRAELIVMAHVADGSLRIIDSRVWRTATRTRTGRRVEISPRPADPCRADGYRSVRVSRGAREYSAKAHRIIWMATHGPIPPGLEINHLDGDRGNNELTNLELVTKSQNLTHAHRVLNRWKPTGERNPQGRLSAAEVAEIRQLHAQGEGQRALGRRFGVTHRAIRMVVTGQSWRSDDSQAVA